MPGSCPLTPCPSKVTNVCLYKSIHPPERKKRSFWFQSAASRRKKGEKKRLTHFCVCVITKLNKVENWQFQMNVRRRVKVFQSTTDTFRARQRRWTFIFVWNNLQIFCCSSLLTQRRRLWLRRRRRRGYLLTPSAPPRISALRRLSIERKKKKTYLFFLDAPALWWQMMDTLSLSFVVDF